MNNQNNFRNGNNNAGPYEEKFKSTTDFSKNYSYGPENNFPEEIPNPIPNPNQNNTDVSNHKSKKYCIISIVLAVLLLITGSLSGVWISVEKSKYNSLSRENGRYEKEITSLKEEIASSTSSSTSLSDEIAILEDEISSLEDEITTLEDENSTLKDDVDKYKPMAEWYDTNARIVIADEGEHYKIYHKYGCDKFPDKYTYWIYNVKILTSDSSYKACPSCNTAG